MSKKTKEQNKIPDPSLRRLPWYLAHVRLLHGQGQANVSSTAIAKGVGVAPSLVAKDLSFVSLRGRTRVGYQTAEVIRVLEDFLGFTSTHKAYIIGVGSLGGALLEDKGLRLFGLDIVGGFDINPEIVGTYIGDTPIYHIEDLKERMQDDEVEIGILTVPASQAQAVCDQLVEAGLAAIWNFTPIRVQAPKPVVLHNTSMYAHLAMIFARIRWGVENTDPLEDDLDRID